jgi:hypothetical protein
MNSVTGTRGSRTTGFVSSIVTVLLFQLLPQAIAADAIELRDPSSQPVTLVNDRVTPEQTGNAPDVSCDPEEDLIAGLRSVLTGRSRSVSSRRGRDVQDTILLRQMDRTQRSFDRSMKTVDDGIRRMNTSINAVKTYERLFRR